MSSSKTALYNSHLELGANINPFSGYLLPTYYTSIKAEHFAVRNLAGLFDVSHMGKLIIEGPNAEDFVNYISTNCSKVLSHGKAQYSLICNHNGGILDDILVYKKKDSFMLVVNSINRKKIYNWLNQHIIKNVNIYDISDNIGIIAIQGPNSLKILNETFKINLSSMLFYSFVETKINNTKALISRTGYTGELGFELYIKNEEIKKIWDDLIYSGSNLGLIPTGLASRDMLRLEMNFNLYGNDINENINPIEAGLSWVVKLNKKSFIGKEAILNLKKNFTYISSCIEMVDKAIPRTGYLVFSKNKKIGKITSGTMSLSKKIGIAKALILKKYYKVGEVIEINVRGNMKKALIVESPFYKSGSMLA